MLWGEASCFFSLLLLACPRLNILESCSLNLSLNNETDKASLIALVRESAGRMHSFKVPSITVTEIKIVDEQTCTAQPKDSARDTVAWPFLCWQFLRGTTVFLYCGATEGWLPSEAVKPRAAVIPLQPGDYRSSWRAAYKKLVTLFPWQFLFSLVGVSNRDSTEHFICSLFSKESPSFEFDCDTFIPFFEYELEDFESSVIWQEAKERT